MQEGIDGMMKPFHVMQTNQQQVVSRRSSKKVWVIYG